MLPMISLEDRIRCLFEDATECLKQRLQSVALAIPTDPTEEDYVRLAVVMLTFACYSAAEAIRVLARANVTLQLPTIVRVQFEAALLLRHILPL
jgi:hypothetical protein